MGKHHWLFKSCVGKDKEYIGESEFSWYASPVSQHIPLPCTLVPRSIIFWDRIYLSKRMGPFR